MAFKKRKPPKLSEAATRTFRRLAEEKSKDRQAKIKRTK